jgi:hypothetical protein
MSASKDSRTGAGGILYAQVAWAVLAAVWNFAGVALIASGQRAPGPTASAGGGIVLLALAVAFVAARSRWPWWVYMALSAVAAFMGAAAVYNAFVQDPALWPSEFWRYAGIVLNGAGAVASVLAVLGQFKSRA